MFLSLIQEGTTTAGETAPNMNPKANAKAQGRSNVKWDITAITEASTT